MSGCLALPGRAPARTSLSPPFCLSLGQSRHPGGPWGEGGAGHDGKEPGGSWHSLAALKSPGWEGVLDPSHCC